jgi:hypothetical protein
MRYPPGWVELPRFVPPFRLRTPARQFSVEILMPSARFPACQPGTTRLDVSSAGRKSPEGSTAKPLATHPERAKGPCRASCFC